MKTRILALGGAAAAVALACTTCAGTTALLALGASAGVLNWLAALEPYRPFIALAGVPLLGVVAWRASKKPTVSCAHDVCSSNDMVSSPRGWLLWGVPIALLLVGAVVTPGTRTLLWTPALIVMGTACLVNVARCRRLHCYITGPLYLLAAVATLLTGLDLVSLAWSWIAATILAGTAIAYVPERIFGRYLPSR